MTRAILINFRNYSNSGKELLVDNEPLINYNLIMKYIELTKGQKAIVDDEDYDWLNDFNWYYAKAGYAARGIRNRKEGWQKKILMHREIMNASIGKEVDHINGDGLDNRRSNLRLATHAQNIRNGKHRTNNTSGYKGVFWQKDHKKWCARIMIDYKPKHLGYFNTPEEAAQAYNEAAIEYSKEFGRLNKV